MNTIAIIQARLGSTRLPNKVLLQIPPESGTCMLQMVVKKTMLATLVDDVVVVTPDSKLAELCGRWGCEAFLPGFAERDVVREYYDVATALDADVIVRITADCPLIRPDEIDRCVKYFLEAEGEYDLLYNTDESTGQLNGEGSDVEVMLYPSLKASYLQSMGSEREHVTQWLRNNTNTRFLPGAPLGIRSVNTKEDYNFVCRYVENPFYESS